MQNSERAAYSDPPVSDFFSAETGGDCGRVSDQGPKSDQGTDHMSWSEFRGLPPSPQYREMHPTAAGGVEAGDSAVSLWPGLSQKEL